MNNQMTDDRSDLLDQLALRMRAEKEAADATWELIDAAHQAGCSWPEIGAALGITPEQARWRWRYGKGDAAPSIRKKKGDKTAAPRPAKGSGPGLSVAEAAEKLGRSKALVYRQIADGTLESTLDSAGYKRVLLDEDEGKEAMG